MVEAALVTDFDSSIVLPGFAGFCAVFPFVVLRSKMRGILFGMDLKDSSTARFWPLG